MAKKESLTKTNEVVIETPSGTKLVGNPNLKGLNTLYEEWKTALGKVGASDLFMDYSSNDLYQVFLSQGVDGRIYGDPTPNRQGEGGVEIDKLISIILDGWTIDVTEIEELESLLVALFFELNEKPLGPYNKIQLDFCLQETDVKMYEF